MVDKDARVAVEERYREEVRSSRDEIPPISDHAAKIPRHSLRSSRATVPLRRKPKMHHVAVGDLVVLAFQPQLADVTRAGLAAALEVILVRNGLGADEAALEIGVNDTGRLDALRFLIIPKLGSI